MFNNFHQLLFLKKKLKKKKIPLIEDNSIYFDNFKSGKLKRFSGYLGDYTILSFNIMKNISAFYGGAVAHNSLEFNNFCNSELKNFQSFSKYLIIRQFFIYLILKLMSFSILYRLIFFQIIYFSDFFNIDFLKKIFYPSLRFEKKSQKKFLYQKISFFFKKVIYLQINNREERKKNFLARKLNNYYFDQNLKKISIKLKKIRFLPISDYNFQNFLDYPLLVDNKNKFVNFMFKNNIEVRKYHYFNCEKFFSTKIKNCKNSEYFEKKLICIPTHPKVTKHYLNFITKKILQYEKIINN
jgi:dTDP-4-amino-4,6-dideoxygalactose transaminase